MQGTDRPNILLILADQLRADALGCYGNTIVETPNLDRLALRGTLFEDAMVTQPTCTPSRASILTGCYPSALRSRMVGCETPDDERFLPRVIAAEGGHPASIGKIHLCPQRSEPELVGESARPDGGYDYYGFREIELVNGHGARCFGRAYSRRLADLHPDHRERYENRTYFERGLPGAKAGTHHWPYDPRIHSSRYVADRAVEFIDRSEPKPFFLHLSFPDPHHLFTVPKPQRCHLGTRPSSTVLDRNGLPTAPTATQSPDSRRWITRKLATRTGGRCGACIKEW